MSKGLIFVFGLVVGAAAGSGVTYILTKRQNEVIEREILDQKDAISTNREELEAYYIQQLRDLGCQIFNPDEDEDEYEEFVENYNRSRVNPIPDEDDEEEEECPAPIEPNPFPYVIDEDMFDTNDDYSTDTIHYYKGDDTFTTEDYDIIDGITDILGKCVDDIKSSDSDAVYVRNESQTCDYEVLIFNDSYKHVVEGEEDDEEELGNMAD